MLVPCEGHRIFSMTDPDPDKDAKKAMGFSKQASRPIRFPELRPRGKTFIDLELRLTWAYLTTADFFMF